MSTLMLALGCVSGACAGAEPGAAANAGITIELKGDRLTARIERAHLRRVLAELHRQAGQDQQSQWLRIATALPSEIAVMIPDAAMIPSGVNENVRGAPSAQELFEQAARHTESSRCGHAPAAAVKYGAID